MKILTVVGTKTVTEKGRNERQKLERQFWIWSHERYVSTIQFDSLY